MVSPETLFQTGDPSSSLFWRAFCKLLGATVSLTSDYHPQSNGQTERLNQEVETCLHCLISQKLATWSKHLIWVKYAHNTLPGSASGLSLFSVLMVTSLLRSVKPKLPYPPPTPSFGAVTASGTGPSGPSPKFCQIQEGCGDSADSGSCLPTWAEGLAIH